MKKLLILFFTLICTQAMAQSDTSLKDYNYLYYSGLNRSYMSTDILINRVLPFSSITFSDGKYDTATDYKGAIEMYNEIQVAAWDSTAYEPVSSNRQIIRKQN